MCPSCTLVDSGMQEQLGLAQEEYQRGLSKLKQTASELKGLSKRVHGSEKTARGEQGGWGGCWGAGVLARRCEAGLWECAPCERHAILCHAARPLPSGPFAKHAAPCLASY